MYAHDGDEGLSLLHHAGDHDDDEGLPPLHHAGDHVYGEGEDDGRVLLCGN